MTQTIEFCKEISQLSNCKSSYLDGDDPMTTLQAFFSYKNIATALIGANGDSKKGQNNSFVPGDWLSHGGILEVLDNINTPK